MIGITRDSIPLLPKRVALQLAGGLSGAVKKNVAIIMRTGQCRSERAGIDIYDYVNERRNGILPEGVFYAPVIFIRLVL